jgi:hypothetical protein
MAGTGFTPLGVIESSTVISTVVVSDASSLTLVDGFRVIPVTLGLSDPVSLQIEEGQLISTSMDISDIFSIGTTESLQASALVSASELLPLGLSTSTTALSFLSRSDSFLLTLINDTFTFTDTVTDETLIVQSIPSTNISAILSQVSDSVGIRLIEDNQTFLLIARSDFLPLAELTVTDILDLLVTLQPKVGGESFSMGVGEVTEEIFVTNALKLYGLRVAWNDEVSHGSWEIEESHERKFFATKI